jgi:hypothetical protein
MASEQDIVLIYMEDKPLVFARIEDIQADHKPGWYHIKLLMLQVPLQVVTWILRDVYIDGETFTMGGKQMRLEKVVCPQGESGPELDESDTEASARRPARVISLAERQRKPAGPAETR